jgi:hypothetical protein
VTCAGRASPCLLGFERTDGGDTRWLQSDLGTLWARRWGPFGQRVWRSRCVRQMAQNWLVLWRRLRRRWRWRVPGVGGCDLDLGAGADGCADERGAAALQVDCESCCDVVCGPADVVAGVLVGGFEMQDVDGAGDAVPEAELLLMWVERHGRRRLSRIEGKRGVIGPRSVGQ